MERYRSLKAWKLKIDDPSKSHKDVEREILAEDIRVYLSNGGVIHKFHHGATALGGPTNKVWEKTLRNDPSKRG